MARPSAGHFLSENSIDIVNAHYQEANIIAVYVQYLNKAKLVITRHYSDCGHLDVNRKEMIADKVINFLGDVCIAPSEKVYHQMVNVEKC